MATNSQRAKKVKTISQQNPHTDARSATEGLKAVDALRALGIRPKGYDLASPYGKTVTHSRSEGRWS